MLNVAVIAGGNSAEHGISLISSKFILNNIDREKFNPIWIVANKNNKFFRVPSNLWENFKEEDVNFLSETVDWSYAGIICQGQYIKLDAAFPIMHGKFGEDGHLQGFLEILNIPYTGSGVTGSNICMKKNIFKQLMRHNHIPILNHIVMNIKNQSYEAACSLLKTKSLFIKPCASGSSLGAHQVNNADEWSKYFYDALLYDNNILVEPCLKNIREIECSVWLNHKLVSIPGEIFQPGAFYDYESKYHKSTTKIIIPAPLSMEEKDSIRNIALKACKIAEVTHFARVDFFKEKNKIYLNEINTLPGFTTGSMFHRLIQAEGYSPSTLINSLIDEAIYYNK